MREEEIKQYLAQVPTGLIDRFKSTGIRPKKTLAQFRPHRNGGVLGHRLMIHYPRWASPSSRQQRSRYVLLAWRLYCGVMALIAPMT